MSILGEFIKQPVEVEVYSIRFDKDMAISDDIASAWQMISLESTPAWDQVIQTVPYTATLADSDRIIVTQSPITLPDTPPEGYRINIANFSQTVNVSVGSFTIPVRGAAIIVFKNGSWVREAFTNAVLVDSPNDQRVRTFVSGGSPWASYSVQVTVVTSEGRTMQDEFIVQIEEA